MTIKFKMTDKEIVTGIKSIGSRARSLRVDVHKIVCAITNNWAAGGAVNVCAERMSQLLNEIDASHKQKLVNWCNSFCSFEYVKSDDGVESFTYDAKKTKLTVKEWGEMKGNNVFDFTPDKPVVPFNFQAKLAALIAQGEKRLKADADKRSDEDAVTQAEIDAAKALIVTKA